MLKFNNVFSDNMIVQRDAPFVIKGTCDCAPVTVEVFADGKSVQSVSASVTDGKFVAVFGAVSDYKKTYSVVASAKDERAELKNVLFGDLFIASGQSNMEYTVNYALNRDEIVASVPDMQKVRACRVQWAHLDPKLGVRIFDEYLEDMTSPSVWSEFTAENVVNYSALATQFCYGLYKKTGVPTGFIDISWGGISADSFVPARALRADKAATDYLKRKGWYIEEGGEYNVVGIRNASQMGGSFSQKVYPFKDFDFKAVLYYQGENSATEYLEGMHSCFMLLMIDEYRKLFKKQIPFFFSQIAVDFYPNEEMGYNYINEEIAALEEKRENVFSIPIYDAPLVWESDDEKLSGNYNPIHPVDKRILASRNVESVFQNLYLCKEFRYPKIVAQKTVGDKIVLTVSEEVEEVGELYGFTIAGADGVYQQAKAKASGKTVEVWSEYVKDPKFTTYAFFLYNGICNLKTKNGPVSQYRTVKESVNGKRYFMLQPYYYCDIPESWEVNHVIFAGGGYFVPTFESGKLSRRNNVEISFDEADKASGNAALCVKATKERSEKYMNRFGVTPNCVLNGCKNYWSDFDRMAITMKGAGVTFFGMLVRTTENIIYRFMPVNAKGEVCHNVPLGTEFQKFGVALDCARNGEDTWLGKEKVDFIRSHVCEVELHFWCFGKGEVKIDEITLYNGKESK